MSKFYMVTNLVPAESSNFQEDVINNIKKKIAFNFPFKVFSIEEEAQHYAEMKTPTNYYFGNPAVVTLDILEEVWAGIDITSKNVKSKDVFFPKQEIFNYKYVQANQINEFISAKGDSNCGRGNVFSLASVHEPEKESSCSIQ